MNVGIMGCGRVGGRRVRLLRDDGHAVPVRHRGAQSFRCRAHMHKGKAIIGDGTDGDSLLRANIDNADVFVATTQGDNRNLLAAQKAKILFHVPKVVCRIYDPIRRELYRDLGIETVSPTIVTSELLKNAIER